MAVEAQLGRGRLLIAARHGGNVTQAEGAAAETQRQCAQVLDGIELAGNADLDVVTRRAQHTGKFDGVLVVDGGNHLAQVDAHARELLLRHLDVKPLFLHPILLDLGHAGHMQQLLAHEIRIVLELGIGIAVRRKRIDHAEDVTEFVVVERPLHAGRQATAHVTGLLAHRVPDAGNVLRRRRLLELDEDGGFARLGVAADLVDVGHFLQRLLELVSDLLGHLHGGGTGPERPHHHGTEGEGRIFILAELEIGTDAGQQQHHQQVHRDRRILDGDARKVETVGVGLTHDGGPQRGVYGRTFWPSASTCTPAVTTRAPAGRPATITSLPSMPASCTGWLFTVSVFSS